MTPGDIADYVETAPPLELAYLAHLIDAKRFARDAASELDARTVELDKARALYLDRPWINVAELHAEVHADLAGSLGREPTQGECVTASAGQLSLPMVKKAHLQVGTAPRAIIER